MAGWRMGAGPGGAVAAGCCLAVLTAAASLITVASATDAGGSSSTLPTLAPWLVPSVWCGRVTVRFSVAAGALSAEQVAATRVWVAEVPPPGVRPADLAAACAWRQVELAAGNVTTAPSSGRQVLSANITGLRPLHYYAYAVAVGATAPPATPTLFTTPACAGEWVPWEVPVVPTTICGVTYMPMFNATAAAAAPAGDLLLVGDVGAMETGEAVMRQAAGVLAATAARSTRACNGTDTNRTCPAWAPPIGALLVGDVAYADNEHNSAVWDRFTDMHSAHLLSHTPVWMLPGNHELKSGFKAEDQGTEYRTRFQEWSDPSTPSPGPAAKLCRRAADSAVPAEYYAFNVGAIHVLTLNAYTNDTDAMAAFVEADLSCVDRGATPWVVVAAHPPWYTTYLRHATDGDDLRARFEDLFVEYGVDLYVAGHIHNVEVTTPMVAGAVDADGPVHLTTGHGGNPEGIVPDMNSTIPPWSLKRNVTADGFSTLHVINASAAELAVWTVDNPDTPWATFLLTSHAARRQEQYPSESPTPSPSSTSTASWSSTASLTSTRSSSNTPSSSSTTSPAASPSQASSNTPSSNSTTSPSTSPSQTSTPTRSSTPTATPSSSKSGASPSGTPSTSPSGTPTRTPSSTPSSTSPASTPSGTPLSTSPATSSAPAASPSALAPTSPVPPASFSTLPTPTGSPSILPADGSSELPASLSEQLPSVVGGIVAVLAVIGLGVWWRARRLRRRLGGAVAVPTNISATARAATLPSTGVLDDDMDDDGSSDGAEEDETRRLAAALAREVADHSAVALQTGSTPAAAPPAPAAAPAPATPAAAPRGTATATPSTAPGGGGSSGRGGRSNSGRGGHSGRSGGKGDSGSGSTPAAAPATSTAAAATPQGGRASGRPSSREATSHATPSTTPAAAAAAPGPSSSTSSSRSSSSSRPAGSSAGVAAAVAAPRAARQPPPTAAAAAASDADAAALDAELDAYYHSARAPAPAPSSGGGRARKLGAVPVRAASGAAAPAPAPSTAAPSQQPTVAAADVTVASFEPTTTTTTSGWGDDDDFDL